MKLYGMPGHLIRRLHQRSTHIFQERAKEVGVDLTSVQFAAMDALRTHPGIDQARVAALIAYDRATIGGVIERLERKGLVERSVSEQDRRARVVQLTETGRALLEEFTPTVSAMQDEILAHLDESERAQFNALLRKALDLDAEAPD